LFSWPKLLIGKHFKRRGVSRLRKPDPWLDLRDGGQRTPCSTCWGEKLSA